VRIAATEKHAVRTKTGKRAKIGLTKLFFWVTMYPSFIKQKAVKGRVGIRSPFREPRVVEWGTAEMFEHGLGAAQATGSL